MDCEKEIMSENEEYLFEHSSCESLTSVKCVGHAQTITQNNEQPLQHANLLLEDPTSSETSWTDEKHSLYLNSIEEAFVSSLYQQGYYTCKRLQADRGETSSVLSLDLNEDAESGFSDGHGVFGFPEESQSESEMPWIHRHVQNHSKQCRLKRICGGSSDKFQEQDRNGKRNKRKLQHAVADPDREITNVFEEVQSRHNDERARGQQRNTGRGNCCKIMAGKLSGLFSPLFFSKGKMNFNVRRLSVLSEHTAKWMQTVDKKSPMELINEVPPIKVEGRIVACEGDRNPALGHPIEFICLDLPVPNVCKYCGLRYVQKDHH